MAPLFKESLGEKEVMLGALAQTGTIPLSAQLFRETIREKTRQAFVVTNQNAFELGFEAAAKVS